MKNITKFLLILAMLVSVIPGAVFADTINAQPAGELNPAAAYDSTNYNPDAATEFVNHLKRGEYEQAAAVYQRIDNAAQAENCRHQAYVKARELVSEGEYKNAMTIIVICSEEKIAETVRYVENDIIRTIAGFRGPLYHYNPEVKDEYRNNTYYSLMELLGKPGWHELAKILKDGRLGFPHASTFEWMDSYETRTIVKSDFKYKRSSHEFYPDGRNDYYNIGLLKNGMEVTLIGRFPGKTTDNYLVRDEYGDTYWIYNESIGEPIYH